MRRAGAGAGARRAAARGPSGPRGRGRGAGAPGASWRPDGGPCSAPACSFVLGEPRGHGALGPQRSRPPPPPPPPAPAWPAAPPRAAPSLRPRPRPRPPRRLRSGSCSRGAARGTRACALPPQARPRLAAAVVGGRGRRRKVLVQTPAAAALQTKPPGAGPGPAREPGEGRAEPPAPTARRGRPQVPRPPHSGLEAENFQVKVWASSIPGGWDADGKGPCVWDTFTHQGGERVFKNQTGDVACGSYTLWEEDLKCIKQLGLTHYRFSLSWSRLLPDGTTGFINQKGIDYYNKIIDDLLTNGVTPIVTLYHFDLPQALEDRGGWLSETIIDSFDKYAQFCFRTFGDRVKQWITINEPNTLALAAYELGIFAPGVPHFGTGGYQAAHNLIKAHAKSWHSYDSLFRKEQKGIVSLSLFAGWVEPADPHSVSDQEAAQRALAFHFDLFAKPIFLDGDYPDAVKSQVASVSQKQGYPASRLPEFTEEEKKMVKGTADFFAVQYYTTRLVKGQNKKGEQSLFRDMEIDMFPDPSWKNVNWVYVVPWGIRKLLSYIKDTYNNPVIYITENGFPQSDPASLDDTQRWEYFRQTLQELFKAIQLDKVNLQVYCLWSLLDNFEWIHGYSSRFGLFHVDFEDPARPRVPYTSAKEYAKVIRNNGLEGHP